MTQICHVHVGESTDTNVQFLCTRIVCNLSKFNPMAPKRSNQEMAAQSSEQGKFHMQKELQQGNNIYKCVKRTLKNTRGLSETTQGKNTLGIGPFPKARVWTLSGKLWLHTACGTVKLFSRLCCLGPYKGSGDTENLIASSSCIEGAMENNHLWCKQMRMKS